MATVPAAHIPTTASHPAHARPRMKVNAWHLVGLLAIFLFAVFPFYWMVATSLRPA